MKKLTFFILILFLLVWVGSMATMTTRMFPGWLDQDGKLAQTLDPYLGPKSAIGGVVHEISALVPDWFGADYKAIVAKEAVKGHGATAVPAPVVADVRPVVVAPQEAPAHAPTSLPPSSVLSEPMPVVPLTVAAVPPAPAQPIPHEVAMIPPAANEIATPPQALVEPAAAPPAMATPAVAMASESAGHAATAPAQASGSKAATLSWQGGVMEIPLVEVLEVDRWSGRPTGKKSYYQASMRYMPQTGTWHMVKWQPVTR